MDFSSSLFHIEESEGIDPPELENEAIADGSNGDSKRVGHDYETSSSDDDGPPSLIDSRDETQTSETSDLQNPIHDLSKVCLPTKCNGKPNSRVDFTNENDRIRRIETANRSGDLEKRTFCGKNLFEDMTKTLAEGSCTEIREDGMDNRKYGFSRADDQTRWKEDDENDDDCLEKDEDKLEDDEDDVTKKLLSIQVLPRIPKIKRIEAVRGDSNAAESSFVHRSVLERAEIVTKSCGYPKWPKASGSGSSNDEQPSRRHGNKGVELKRGAGGGGGGGRDAGRSDRNGHVFNRPSSVSTFQQTADKSSRTSYGKRITCEQLFDAIMAKENSDSKLSDVKKCVSDARVDPKSCSTDPPVNDVVSSFDDGGSSCSGIDSKTSVQNREPDRQNRRTNDGTGAKCVRKLDKSASESNLQIRRPFDNKHSEKDINRTAVISKDAAIGGTGTGSVNDCRKSSNACQTEKTICESKSEQKLYSPTDPCKSDEESDPSLKLNDNKRQNSSSDPIDSSKTNSIMRSYSSCVKITSKNSVRSNRRDAGGGGLSVPEALRSKIGISVNDYFPDNDSPDVLSGFEHLFPSPPKTNNPPLVVNNRLKIEPPSAEKTVSFTTSDSVQSSATDNLVRVQNLSGSTPVASLRNETEKRSKGPVFDLETCRKKLCVVVDIKETKANCLDRGGGSGTPKERDNGDENLTSKLLSSAVDDALTEVVDMDVVASPLCDDHLVLSSEPTSAVVSNTNSAAAAAAGISIGRKVVTFDCPERTNESCKDVQKKPKPAKREKEKHSTFEKKCDIQEQVVCEMKEILRPLYSKRKITKEEYKEIMRQAVPKICHSKKSGALESRIKRYAEKYTNEVLKLRKSKKEGGDEDEEVKLPS